LFDATPTRDEHKAKFCNQETMCVLFEMMPALKVCCERLMRNDPTFDDVCVPIFLPQFLKRFSCSLPKCTSVTSLTFDVFVYDKSEYNLDSMLKYLSETNLIRRVRFNSNDGYDPCAPNAHEAGRLIRAMADNARLELIEFSSSGVPLHAREHYLVDLLQSKASSLRHLTLQQLQCEDNPPWSELDVAAFASAVGALTLLQSLTLQPFPNPELSALTLCQLSSHTRLQKLSIDGYDSEWGSSDSELADDQTIVNAVSVMLQSRVPLEILELRHVSISKTSMNHLLRGLESCSSLVELALVGSMGDETERALVCFLRTGISTAVNAIRRLCLRNLNGVSHLFPSILTTDDKDQQPMIASIGASLQALSLPYLFQNIDVLLDVLVAGAHHLSSLSLGCLTFTSWSQLIRRLPDLVHLKELPFQFDRHQQNEISSVDFVRAMRKNGSLCRVSEIYLQSKARFPTPLFRATELQKIRIYGQRNQETREMLQNPCLPCDEINIGSTKTPLSMLPILFHVMKPAKRVAPNCVLVGLLACSGTLGPEHSHKKRLGPEH
jgi:hypothetical protein